jgi:hypothetical protein
MLTLYFLTTGRSASLGDGRRNVGLREFKSAAINRGDKPALYSRNGGGDMMQNAKPPAAGGAAGAIALHQRQLEILDEAVRIALEGAQSIATRQSETMSELHQQIAALISRPNTPPNVNDGIATALAFAKQALDAGIAHGIALTEIGAKMETDALKILNKSVTANLTGVDDILQKLPKFKT